MIVKEYYVSERFGIKKILREHSVEFCHPVGGAGRSCECSMSGQSRQESQSPRGGWTGNRHCFSCSVTSMYPGWFIKPYFADNKEAGKLISDTFCPS